MSLPPAPVLALQSHGMVTVIGNSAAQTLASWCAESRRTRRLFLEDFADPFTIADCQGVTDGLAGVDRLAALLASAVAEALDGAAHLEGDGECLEILLVPAWLDDAACAKLGALLSTWVLPYEAWSGRARSRLVVRAGAAGAWVALEHAYRALAASPHLRHIMLAAVDSACEPAVLQQAAHADWLLRPGNEQGYVAGEAGACVLLQRARTIDDVPAGGFAVHRPALVQAPQRFGPGLDDPDPGSLSQALAAALAGSAMGPTHISHLQSDMDGSDWRARLEAAALNRVIFSAAAALPHWLPASLFGQVGNAGGVIAWLLLSGLHRQQVERVNTVLSWSVDPAGQVAACVLERSPH
ncbi:hypothetical protein OU994_28275 [Pseudoduganella sp. SL102]|uniref:hypothetical protein n=1 Tax=Pseudoduganella sp. SL102 TaxID=2995154 RepID=UPI00248C0B44|nr:hypothetical protein [Pseudoduganella sp. SL102]WBS02107.1 hypothetical protein OU994_28275 [Pseudoduganella sp. SL102]